MSADRVDSAEADEDGGGGDAVDGVIENPTENHREQRRETMTQEERWMTRYNEVVSFIETNHRNPSKYAPEEKLLVHFLKRGRKLMNAGELKEPRLSRFKELMELSERYRRKNQYD